MSLCINGIPQVTPAEKQSKSILLVGGTAHLGNGSVIQKSVIGFKNGIINHGIKIGTLGRPNLK